MTSVNSLYNIKNKTPLHQHNIQTTTKYINRIIIHKENLGELISRLCEVYSVVCDRDVKVIFYIRVNVMD